MSGVAFQSDELAIMVRHRLIRSAETPELMSGMVKHYEKLVHSQVHHLKWKTGEPYEDLFQVGMVGLIKALRRFDATFQVSFTSFAVPYIKGDILHYLRDKSSMVRVPRKWHEIHSKLRKGEKENLGFTDMELAVISNACENRTITKELSFDIPDKAYKEIDDCLHDVEQELAEFFTKLQSKVSSLPSLGQKTVEQYYFQSNSINKTSQSMRLSPVGLKEYLNTIVEQLSVS